MKWPAKHAPPHMWFHAEFGRYALKGVRINTGKPQNWGAMELGFLGWVVADPRYTPLSTVLSRQIQ